MVATFPDAVRMNVQTLTGLIAELHHRSSFGHFESLDPAHKPA